MCFQPINFESLAIRFVILFQQDDIKDKKRNGNREASKTSDLRFKQKMRPNL